MNLLRDIPAGDNPPDIVNVVIEVISGSRDKYEYRIDWEVFVLDRMLYSSVVFPVEYGFMPQTWFDDNDPLDIMVLSYEPLEVGCLVKARPIGVLIMEDEEGEDPKILSVPISDPRFNGFNGLTDVHPHKLREIQEFFEVYKRLEPKVGQIQGMEKRRRSQKNRQLRHQPIPTKENIDLCVNGSSLQLASYYSK